MFKAGHLFIFSKDTKRQQYKKKYNNEGELCKNLSYTK